jgi:acyl-CoA synthetase (NDP forming)
VILGLTNVDEVTAAAKTLAARCAKINAPLEGILVARQMTGGVEMVVGLHRDPEMGPVVMVGMGGVWLELFKDVAFAPPGLGRARALETIRQTRASKLLEGYRGSPALDIEALADTMVAVGRLACELGDVIEAVDINPLLVCANGEGVVALDGLVVLRPPTRGDSADI